MKLLPVIHPNSPPITPVINKLWIKSLVFYVKTPVEDAGGTGYVAANCRLGGRIGMS